MLSLAQEVFLYPRREQELQEIKGVVQHFVYVLTEATIAMQLIPEIK